HERQRIRCACHPRKLTLGIITRMTAFDFGEYSKRIGYSGTAGPDLATFCRLHRAHMGAIPFENLDIQMGRTVKLDPDALQAKMVRQRRGGYCFEQNSLFMLALR